MRNVAALAFVVALIDGGCTPKCPEGTTLQTRGSWGPDGKLRSGFTQCEDENGKRHGDVVFSLNGESRLPVSYEHGAPVGTWSVGAKGDVSCRVRWISPTEGTATFSGIGAPEKSCWPSSSRCDELLEQREACRRKLLVYFSRLAIDGERVSLDTAQPPPAAAPPPPKSTSSDGRLEIVLKRGVPSPTEGVDPYRMLRRKLEPIAAECYAPAAKDFAERESRIMRRPDQVLRGAIMFSAKPAMKVITNTFGSRHDVWIEECIMKRIHPMQRELEEVDAVFLRFSE